LQEKKGRADKGKEEGKKERNRKNILQISRLRQ
jgi:hypothetical protein